MFALSPPRSGRSLEFWGGITLTMLSGFNTNFRYRGVLFHVQTEDSGLENPHVITHLFHGGNIIASEKQKYADLLGEDDLEKAVKKLMEGQHKAMLKQLSRGEHDAAIGERIGPDVLEAENTADSADSRSVTEEERPSILEAPETESPITRGMAEPTVLAPESPPPEPEETTSGLSRVFGDRVVSEKPLDEVVLDYLVENARKRRRHPK